MWVKANESHQCKLQHQNVLCWKITGTNAIQKFGFIFEFNEFSLFVILQIILKYFCQEVMMYFNFFLLS